MEYVPADANTWLKPSEPSWDDDSEDYDLYAFYRNKVKISKREWEKNCEYIDYMLEHFFKQLRSYAEKYCQCIEFEDFVRQGSSREGLKVRKADEFDAVLPFRFNYFDTEVIESPGNGLPPGLAEMKVTTVYPGPIPDRLVKKRNDGSFISTEVFHERIFKSLIDMTVNNFQKENTELQRKGLNVCFKITRRSHAPAMILEILVNKEFISVDVVPGFLIDSLESKKFLVSRCIPDSLNSNLRYQLPDGQTAWRISLSHYEMRIINSAQYEMQVIINGAHCDLGRLRLITACRILKAVQSCDWRGHPSQFNSVVKSYHLKNVLLYAILYTAVRKRKISTVTEAFGCLVTLMQTALTKGKLPQCFTDKYALRSFFPNEKQPLAKENLFAEKSTDSLNQAHLDLKRVLSDCKLNIRGNFDDMNKFFIDRINGVEDEPRNTWDSIVKLRLHERVLGILFCLLVCIWFCY